MPPYINGEYLGYAPVYAGCGAHTTTECRRQHPSARAARSRRPVPAEANRPRATPAWRHYFLVFIDTIHRCHRLPRRVGAIGSRRGTGRPRIALLVMLGAQLMIILDATVVNIALPHIQQGLHFSATSLSWVLNAYTLTFGGLLLLGGRAGDILGRRRVFIGGIALFTAASLAGGLATSAGWARGPRRAGRGGALASPAVLALIVGTFPEGRERTRALGVYTGVVTGGASLGLVLGGVITEWASWRWVLFINVPIGIAVALATPLFISESPRQPGHFDLAGALTSTVGMASLVTRSSARRPMAGATG